MVIEGSSHLKLGSNTDERCLYQSVTRKKVVKVGRKGVTREGLLGRPALVPDVLKVGGGGR